MDWDSRAQKRYPGTTTVHVSWYFCCTLFHRRPCCDLSAQPATWVVDALAPLLPGCMPCVRVLNSLSVDASDAEAPAATSCTVSILIAYMFIKCYVSECRRVPLGPGCCCAVIVATYIVCPLFYLSGTYNAGDSSSDCLLNDLLHCGSP